MAEKKKNLGGRPLGAVDKKPRKRRIKKGSDPWAKKTKGRPSNKTSTNCRLLLEHLRRYDFNIVSEILWVYDQLKGKCIIEKTEDGVEMRIYEKEVTAQMLDILKTLIQHSFPKMKALELKSSGENPITLNFNLGGKEVPKKIEGTAEEVKEEAIDMLQGPGGFHIPILKEN